MALIIYTDTPKDLLQKINKAIGSEKIKTWGVDEDGDFTHTASQWNREAWLRPEIESGRIVLNIFPPKNRKLSSILYAIYHGRFIEMLLAHFDTDFSKAEATALPSSGDEIGEDIVDDLL